MLTDSPGAEAAFEKVKAAQAGAFDRVDPPETEKILDCVHCGFCLEADEEITFDTMAPRRNGATLVSTTLPIKAFSKQTSVISKRPASIASRSRGSARRFRFSLMKALPRR